MNITLVGINSKYIHTNLAIRYLKANCDYLTSIKEYTIKDNIESIASSLLATNSHILAFSVYIWNITIVKELCKIIKKEVPDTIIILGGPEVSYDSESLISDGYCDYIISGEGEISFNLLVKTIVDNNKDFNNIPNLIYLYNNIVKQNRREVIRDLNSLNNPYHFEIDNDSIRNKISYVELSRGCPYHCTYCLASVDNQLRYFNLDRLINDVEYLYERGAKTFKFLDRSFNIKPKLARDFFDYIIKKGYRNAVFQFEINGDILSDELIDYLNDNSPKNLIRFEIGIQSTNNVVNKAINRYQNTDKLLSNIKRLVKGPLSLHLDLIAGLPYEDLNSFKNTFDTVYKLYAKELQLGFLKILKGTVLSYETSNYEYEFSDLPPYEIIKNKFISQNELDLIHIAEDVLDTYWNKGFMYNSLKYLTQDLESPFDFFLEFGNYINRNNFSLHKYQLTDLFENILEFAKVRYPNKGEILDYLKYDYLMHHKIKPKLFWDNSHIKKNEIIRQFHSSNQNYIIDDLYKYALITDYLGQYLIIIYFPDKKITINYKP